MPTILHSRIVFIAMMIPMCWGFTPPQHLRILSQQLPIASPSSLYGVRSAWKRRFGRLNRPSPEQAPVSNSIDSDSKESQESRANSAAVAELPVSSDDDESSFRNDSDESPLLKVGYTMPPIGDRELTRFEREFRDMVATFAEYTYHDLLSVGDYRLRSVYEGVAASADEPAVYRAFEVLYEDLAPLRIAGRLIYGRLQNVMQSSKEQGEQEVSYVANVLGLTKDEVEKARIAFLTNAVRENNEPVITVDQLKISGMGEMAAEVLGYDDYERFLEILDPNQRGSLGFQDLMLGIYNCAEEQCSLDRCNPAEVVQELTKRMNPTATPPEQELDPKRQKFSDRYTEMVETFKGWEDYVPTGKGRRLDVFRGCFVGARNEKVVNALRIVYVDYSPLRVAGDLIFRLMSAIANNRMNQ